MLRDVLRWFSQLQLFSAKEVPLIAILTRNIYWNFFPWVLINMWVQFLEKTAYYQPFKKGHFVRACTEKMMDHQYKVNSARNIYSNYNQTRALCWMLSKSIKKLYLIDPSIHAYKMVTTTVCVQIENCFCNKLSISVRRWGDFVARFCQPSRNVFENKMTSSQWLSTPVMDHELSVNMMWITSSLMSG